jgi:hypothetical protein
VQRMEIGDGIVVRPQLELGAFDRRSIRPARKSAARGASEKCISESATLEVAR